jgi:DNA-directed RNA polymerase specialized sigma24 family protein
MQDRELVAGILTGDPDALAEAYDRYAEQLYAYCQSILPDPRPPGEAADAVADTFTIATARLQGLRDPDQLGSWLHAVARNECLRRLGAAGLAASDGTFRLASDGTARLASDSTARPTSADAAGLASDAALSEVSAPDGLRERVLTDGADNTPTGRAHRVSVTHRAGVFGRTGFPKPIIPAGPRWWHEVRRRPRAAAGVAAVAVAVVAAGTAALLITGGTHRAVASTVALGGGNFATSSAPSSPAGGRSSASPEPTPASGTPSTTSPTDGPTAAQITSPGTPRSSRPARSSPPPSRSPSPSPSPSSSPPPPGTLQVTPNQVVLSAVKGKAASGTFLVTAVGGPVNFLITSPNGKVTVSPQSGSLSAAGSWMTVTVTVRSLTALLVRLTIAPGNLVVTVVFGIKA